MPTIRFCQNRAGVAIPAPAPYVISTGAARQHGGPPPLVISTGAVRQHGGVEKPRPHGQGGFSASRFALRSK